VINAYGVIITLFIVKFTSNGFWVKNISQNHFLVLATGILQNSTYRKTKQHYTEVCGNFIVFLFNYFLVYYQMLARFLEINKIILLSLRDFGL
jgi:hypothetical protein